MATLGRAARMATLYRKPGLAYRNRLGRGPAGGEVVYELRGGPRLVMAPGAEDVRVLNEVWLDRVYEPRDDFRVADGWVVLDVGAHKGAFSVRAALAGPRTRVHAVEPVPANADALRRSLAINGIANVTVHEAAVAAERGTARLVHDPELPARGSLAPSRTGARTIEVETLTLDDLVASAGGTVDLLKLDVEGAEYDVLGTARALDRIARIAIEYHPLAGLTAADGATRLTTLLVERGFRCEHDASRRLIWATGKVAR